MELKDITTMIREELRNIMNPFNGIES